MIRLFASDMDGTLLSSSGTISRYTADFHPQITDLWNRIYRKYRP